MASLIDYRAGWSATSGVPIHAVPADNNIALCGVACIHFDGQPFSAKPGHCRTCVRILRDRTRM